MSLQAQVRKGVKWTTISTILLALTAIFKMAILTRFLNKVDFGLMAIVTFVIGFTDLFNDMGFTSAILHKQDISKDEYASLYWLNLITSVFIYLVLCIITPFIASFYNQPKLSTLIPILGLNIIFSGMGRQFKTIENKNMLFKQVAIIDIVSAIISLFFSIILAMEGFGVNSLVYSALLQFLLSNLSFLISGIKKNGLLFHFKLSEARPFLKIGSYQVGGQVVNYFNRDLDVLLIGKFFSAEVLGGYSLAKQLVFRPAQIINPVLTRVAAPALAKSQSDINLLKNNYLHLLDIVSSINIVVYSIIILFAPIAIKILYGPGYDSIIMLVRILSIYMIFRAISNPVGSLVIATGRTDLEFKWNLVTLLVMPIFIIVGAKFGIITVTISITSAMIVLFIPNWKILINSMTGATLSEYMASIVKFSIVKDLIYRFKSRNVKLN